MPLKLQCSLCECNIPIEEDYFKVMISVYEFDGDSRITDSNDNQYDDFCEKCLSKDKGIAGILYGILNERNPNPDLKK